MRKIIRKKDEEDNSKELDETDIKSIELTEKLILRNGHLKE